MYPIISAKEFLQNQESIARFQGLTCWLLYSDMHTVLCRFVREKWAALDSMSGNDCLVCLVDTPCREDDPYWKGANMNPHLRLMLECKPLTRNVHLEIARAIGVEYTSLPALVFFAGVHQPRLVVVTLSEYESEEGLTREFSEAFDCVQASLSKSSFGQEVALASRGAISERRRCTERLQHVLRKRKIVRGVKNLSRNQWSTLLGILSTIAQAGVAA